MCGLAGKVEEVGLEKEVEGLLSVPLVEAGFEKKA